MESGEWRVESGEWRTGSDSSMIGEYGFETFQLFRVEAGTTIRCGCVLPVPSPPAGDCNPPAVE